MFRGESRVVSEGRGHLEVVAAQALTNNHLGPSWQGGGKAWIVPIF